jgi:hypothetical protein
MSQSLSDILTNTLATVETFSVCRVSPVPLDKAQVLQVGDLYIGLDGRELGQVGRQEL